MVLHFSLVRLFARSEKEESCRTNFQRKRDPTAKRKTSARASSESTEIETKAEHFGVKIPPNMCPHAASEGNLAPRASWEAPGDDFGAIWIHFGTQNRSGKGSQNKLIFGPILGRPKGRQVPVAGSPPGYSRTAGEDFSFLVAVTPSPAPALPHFRLFRRHDLT